MIRNIRNGWPLQSSRQSSRVKSRMAYTTFSLTGRTPTWVMPMLRCGSTSLIQVLTRMRCKKPWTPSKTARWQKSRRSRIGVKLKSTETGKMLWIELPSLRWLKRHCSITSRMDSCVTSRTSKTLASARVM